MFNNLTKLVKILTKKMQQVLFQFSRRRAVLRLLLVSMKKSILCKILDDLVYFFRITNVHQCFFTLNILYIWSHCIKNNFAKYIFYYFTKSSNLFISIFCFTHYSNLSKWYIPIHTAGQIKEHVLHNFTKYFSGVRVKQIVNKCFNM